MPDELSPQVPILVDVLAAAGIDRVGAPGYEADDIIGTLATRARGPVDIVTGDRDLFQLVDDARGIRVLYTARGIGDIELVDEAARRREVRHPGPRLRRLRRPARRPERRAARRGRGRREDGGRADQRVRRPGRHPGGGGADRRPEAAADRRRAEEDARRRRLPRRRAGGRGGGQRHRPAADRGRPPPLPGRPRRAGRAGRARTAWSPRSGRLGAALGWPADALG